MPRLCPSSHACLKQPQRADDLRLLRLRLVLHKAEAIIGTQVYHKLCQLLVVDAASHLAVERIFGRFAQRLAVDFVESGS